MKVYHRFATGGRVYAPECTEHGADQSFQKEADINVIMQRYQRTGIISSQNRKTPFWGDVSMAPVDLIEAQEVLQTSRRAFEQLPAMLRAMFQNSPVELIRWLDDPANDAEAVKWGLKEAPQGGTEVPPESVKKDEK